MRATYARRFRAAARTPSGSRLLRRRPPAAIAVGLILAALLSVPPRAQAERIKDLAQIQGVRTNQLVGYGLVVGLDSTGDQTSQAPFTVQSLNNMLAQLGITVPANVTPQLKNVAAVAVHAVMPAFVKPGQTIDITVNSIANAKSLRGGSLLVTPLHGLDGQGSVPVHSGRCGTLVTPNPIPRDPQERGIGDEVVQIVEPAMRIITGPTVQLGLDLQYPVPRLEQGKVRIDGIHRRHPF